MGMDGTRNGWVPESREADIKKGLTNGNGTVFIQPICLNRLVVYGGWNTQFLIINLTEPQRFRRLPESLRFIFLSLGQINLIFRKNSTCRQNSIIF